MDALGQAFNNNAHYCLTMESLHSAAVEAEEFNLVAILKPRIFIDGDQWCVLYGQNIQDGVAGFGKSPILAIYDFNNAWRTELPSKLLEGSK
jgi:hypothetical protein